MLYSICFTNVGYIYLRLYLFSVTFKNKPLCLSAPQILPEWWASLLHLPAQEAETQRGCRLAQGHTAGRRSTGQRPGLPAPTSLSSQTVWQRYAHDTGALEPTS